MKKIFLLLFSLFTISAAFAQQKGLTDTGEQVILFDDGTWKYQNEDDNKESVIPTNSKVFIKDNNSNFLLKSNKLNVGFWLDPTEWSFTKASDNPEAEYELQLKGEDLYGMIISEKLEIPLESLKTIAVDNAKEAASDIKVVKEEYRIVNGIKVLLLQLNGTLQGIKFSYYGYYFSSKNGTVQFITYTSQSLLDSYKNDCEKLLNGFVEIN